MSEVKKIATRESYGNALKELGEENPNIIVLDADLAGATKTGNFFCQIQHDFLCDIKAPIVQCPFICLDTSIQKLISVKNTFMKRNRYLYTIHLKKMPLLHYCAVWRYQISLYVLLGCVNGCHNTY